jgi:hypothetical protein
MKLGLIVEGKNDFNALRIIIKKIVNDDQLEILGAFKDGKTGIIHQKKLLSNKLKNQGCTKVFIIRDSDGTDVATLEADIKRAYNDTQICEMYEVAFAIEELEAWFLSDEASLIQMYSLPRTTMIKILTPDAVHDPKETLKECIKKHSNGGAQYLESDSVDIAELLNIETVNTRSPSFSAFASLISSNVS